MDWLLANGTSPTDESFGEFLRYGFAVGGGFILGNAVCMATSKWKLVGKAAKAVKKRLTGHGHQ